MVGLDAIIDLPLDDEEAFLQFEEHARTALQRKIDNADREQSYQPFWLAFMTEIQQAAFECGVGGFDEWAIKPPVSSDLFDIFDSEVYAVTVRLKFRVARRRRGEIMHPDTAERERLNFRIKQLREEVEASDLAADKKAALNKKLDELVAVFGGERVNRGKVLVVLAAIGALVTQAQGAILKGPETVVAIMDTINLVIGKDDERQALLERYRKPLAIEDKSKTEAEKKPHRPPAREQFVADIDDEIPF